jgi:hypothetical protein
MRGRESGEVGERRHIAWGHRGQAGPILGKGALFSFDPGNAGPGDAQAAHSYVNGELRGRLGDKHALEPTSRLEMEDIGADGDAGEDKNAEAEPKCPQSVIHSDPPDVVGPIMDDHNQIEANHVPD